MLPRVLETEAMDTEVEAVDYDAMDHSAVNRLFVENFLASWNPSPTIGGDSVRSPEILDVGTGTAQIPIELCRQSSDCRVVAVDLANEMLKLAARNVATAGFGGRIRLERADAKRLSFADASFDAVVSNSIVHHIPEPRLVIAEMRRILRPGGLLFVRDLLRPPDSDTVERLVVTYAGNENRHQQQMFRDSFHAALTLAEVGEILDWLGLDSGLVAQTSDRHWTISARC